MISKFKEHFKCYITIMNFYYYYYYFKLYLFLIFSFFVFIYRTVMERQEEVESLLHWMSERWPQSSNTASTVYTNLSGNFIMHCEISNKICFLKIMVLIHAVTSRQRLNVAKKQCETYGHIIIHGYDMDKPLCIDTPPYAYVYISSQ